MERAARECESHVSEADIPASGIPSNAVQVELCMNQSRPWDKAKYYPATDSEQVPRGKGEKNPSKGSEKNLQPFAYKVWEHQKGCDRVPFA